MNAYTMIDWERDGVFSPSLGQEIADDVYFEMLSCLPPAYWEKGIMQVGEPYSHDMENGRTLYTTFAVKDGKWTFAGYCYYGTTEQSKHIYL
jgi:hypothetical protein